MSFSVVRIERPNIPTTAEGSTSRGACRGLGGGGGERSRSLRRTKCEVGGQPSTLDQIMKLVAQPSLPVIVAQVPGPNAFERTSMLGIVSVDCTRRTLVGDSSGAQQKTGSSSRKKTRASIRPGMLTHIHEGCDYDPHPCYPFRLLAEGCDFWTGCDGEEAEESGRWSGLCPTWLRR
jgi:hypothetical protein